MRLLLTVVFIFFYTRIPAQQNVIIILADDLGADYCGFSANATDTAKMPNIRNLWYKGVRFKNVWASPYCSSTRAGALTGRYGFRTTVGTVIGPPNSNDLDSSEISIAELLKYFAPLSYATANIGKWHMNVQTPQKLLYPTNAFGYDLYKGIFSGTLPDYYNWYKITNGVQTDTITNYATTETIDDAIAWLDTLPNSKPFFLWLAFNAPHTPLHLPPANLHSVPGLTGTPQHINQNPKLYFKAMIEAMDTETGRLIQWLITNNKMDSTHIIFMGDNGNEKRVSQIADTTHIKGTLYEYGIHVPCLISGPAVVNPNRSSNALINAQDMFATIMEMAGFANWQNFVPAATTIDSRSIMPILKNQAVNVRDWIFTELFTPIPTAKDGKTIRNADYKLIKFDNGTQQFFQINNDPTEQNNLLLQNLTAVELSNYNYLCNELSGLTGIPSCLTGVATTDLQNIELPARISKSGDQIYCQSQLPFQIKILSSEGNLVSQKQFTAGRHYISIEELSSGIYFIELKNEKSKITEKILK